MPLLLAEALFIDEASRASERLTLAALRIVAEELTDRLKTCSDVGCRSPFCGARIRMRRFRQAA